MAANRPKKIVEPLAKNNYNFPGQQCHPVTFGNGSKKFARIQISSNNNNTRKQVRNNLLKETPVYTSETFLSAPNGIYIWLISDKGFFANRALSKLEHGTKHMHLANRTGSTEIYAAGEAKKGVNESGQNTFEFNLLSGTYTRSLLNNINNNNKRTAASNAIITLAKEAFSSMGFKDITYDESLRTYISQKMNPTAEELQLYKAVGYDIFLCDTKESCNPVFQIAKLEGDKRAQEAVKRYYKENPEKLAEIDKTIAKIDLEIEELRKPCPKMAGGGSRRRRHRRTRRKH